MKMNKLGLFCLVGVLFLAGCGKKAKVVEPVTKTKKIASADVPTLTEDFLDDGDVQTFAFVDDKDNEKDIKEVTNQDNAKIKSNPVLAMAENDNDNEEFGSDDADLKEEGEGDSGYAFNVINFDFNKNAIRQDQVAKLDENCEIAREALENRKQLVIKGYCDEFGSASYNLALSEQRAKSVREAMAAKGIDVDDIKTIGLGQEAPLVASNATDRMTRVAELAPNRRAEIDAE